jgi:rSAM/selenodomain-associated transferase 2/rSAM/selenodomain-associated transferase 1
VTRYPVPGLVKTRLAASVGPRVACALHRELAERAVGAARGLAACGEADVTVWHDGGDERDMVGWLGDGLRFRRQPRGHFGVRIAAALSEGLAAAERCVVIGSDCPDVDGSMLRRALTALDGAPVVLGPADDGGYWLIGARRDAADRVGALFAAGIPWSTPQVADATRRRAARAGLAVAIGPRTYDVDTADDLARWRRSLAAERAVSVVVCALDEEALIERAVRSARCGAAEVIVVDGGSRDATRALARQAGATVVRSAAGRGRQFAAGARAAAGGVLLFMHADTRLPAGWRTRVLETLAQPSVAAGAFSFAVDGERPRDIVAGWLGRARGRLTSHPYGDQPLFVRSHVYADIGGHPDLPVMEDWELVARLKRLGRIEIVPDRAPSSPRAWDAFGLTRSVALNAATIAGYRLGVDPERLAALRGRVAVRPGPAESSPAPPPRPLWEEA